jgi:glycosyltransferase involved in cell wall biosynthesis
MLRRVLEGANVTTVLSAAAAAPFHRYLGFEPLVLPAGVDLSEFAPGERHPEPTFFCASAFTDPRKRISLLLEAFAGLRERVPEARLLLTDLAGAPARPRLPDGAEWVAVDAPGALAAAYAAAWATVLPSVHEAQGLVLLESLASGTPVVASRSGFPPEVLGGAPEAGRLFEPDDSAGLARAMTEALALAGDAGTAAACVGRAEGFSWTRLIGRHEEAYAMAARERTGR